MMRRRVIRGLTMFAVWWLVQVPARDVRLSNPGSNMPPITEFKKVRQFDSGAACESFRDINLQDSAAVGSDAMLDQASSLRCVSEDQLAPPTAASVTPPAP